MMKIFSSGKNVQTEPVVTISAPTAYEVSKSKPAKRFLKVGNLTEQDTKADTEIIKTFHDVIKFGIKDNNAYWSYLTGQSAFQLPYAYVDCVHKSAFDGLWTFIDGFNDNSEPMYLGRFSFTVEFDKVERARFSDANLTIAIPGVRINMSEKTGWTEEFMRKFAIDTAACVLRYVFTHQEIKAIVYENSGLPTCWASGDATESVSENAVQYLSKIHEHGTSIDVEAHGLHFPIHIYNNGTKFLFYGGV